MRDIGTAISGSGERPAGGLGRQKPAIILAVQRVPGANVIETVDASRRLLPRLQASIPPAIKVIIASDRTPPFAPPSPTSSSR